MCIMVALMDMVFLIGGNDKSNGIFCYNGLIYRMKFPLKVPSSYPRLKLDVYDANVFGSDESIGSRALSLKRLDPFLFFLSLTSLEILKN